MSNECLVLKLEARKELLNARDPISNVNIIRKINRNIKKYSNK